MLNGADHVAKDVEGTARHMVKGGYTCDILREMPYNVWRDYDLLDTVRSYALRLKEAGTLKSTFEEVERGPDFRFKQLKEELQEA